MITGARVSIMRACRNSQSHDEVPPSPRSNVGSAVGIKGNVQQSHDGGCERVDELRRRIRGRWPCHRGVGGERVDNVEVREGRMYDSAVCDAQCGSIAPDPPGRSKLIPWTHSSIGARPPGTSTNCRCLHA
jgi:hypothetical protein